MPPYDRLDCRDCGQTYDGCECEEPEIIDLAMAMQDKDLIMAVKGLKDNLIHLSVEYTKESDSFTEEELLKELIEVYF